MNYCLETIKENIHNYATSCNFNYGSRWYIEEHQQILNVVISSRHLLGEIPLTVYLGVISILSPANKWDRNKWDAYFLIKDLVNEGTSNYKCSTYGTNVVKATNLVFSWKRLHQSGTQFSTKQLVLDYIKAPKTRNFFLNLLDPYDETNFTVDRHMLTICGLKKEFKPTTKRYVEITEAFRSVYYELKTKGIVPTTVNLVGFQASLWCNLVLTKHAVKHVG